MAAVSHQQYLAMGVDKLTERLLPGGVFTDVKSCYEPAQIEAAGAALWRL